MITVQNNSSTNRIKILTTAALLAVNLTTTTISYQQNYSVFDSRPYVVDNDVKIGETTTPNTKEVNLSEKSTYEKATEIIQGEIRGFTKEEAEDYYNALEKLYEPLGVNIFDLC